MEGGGGEDEILPGYESIDKFSQANLKRILGVTKISNDLPGEKREDYDYYSTFPEFRKTMATQGKKLKEMIKTQLNFQGIKAGVSTSSIDALVDLLTDANDTILERININLDEAAGIKKDVDPALLEITENNVSKVAGSWNNFDRRKKKPENGEVKLLAAKNVLRPQVKFKKFIDNTSKPFSPRLTDKPHSKKPLSVLVEYDDNNVEFFSHPYLFEIERLTHDEEMLAHTEATLPKTVETTEMKYVQTSDELREMISELRAHSVIGVDVEGHTYRSYQGITCLIQLSTNTKDYLVDPFNIWEEMTQLNEIFADPKIVKVLHGCAQDVVWLQRDFSLYLVNVFDTHQAGKLLGFPRLSLAWLLERYCKIYADKQYQLADWRIRPLPEVMVYYARQDTRYLIYLYHKLKGELLDKGNDQKNLLLSAYQQSNIICTTRYNKPEIKPDSHESLLKKTKSVCNNRQLYALQELYSWRDGKARLEDESTNYVLPNHMLLKISTELPREMQGILACCNPIPPLVKQNLQEIHMIILKARNKPVQTVDSDLLTSRSATAGSSGLLADQQAQLDFNDNPLLCPLDLGRIDLGAGLPTLIDTKTDSVKKLRPAVSSQLIKSDADLIVFSRAKSRKSDDRQPKIKAFVSPYQRFRLLVPYLEKLKVDENGSDGQEDPTAQTEDLQLQNIKKHFQKLTDMTPKPKKSESRPEEEEDMEEDEGEIQEVVDSEDEKSDDLVQPIRAKKREKPAQNDQDREKIMEERDKRAKLMAEVDKEVEKRKIDIENKLVQEEITKKKMKKKRKSDSTLDVDSPSKIPREEFNYEDEEKKNAVKEKEKFNYANQDFTNMFAAKRPDASRDFNPYHDHNNKKNKAMKKQKK
eukprot:TRINITY_DN3379_c0_g1_i1.p1 TRINITY_DN3379_c0_g1~~TRINITY_DN3379_c0_g1_i1.p1  ORF type:complete len:868 (-),score=234.75 TRINITY_DN3379_c0_g1_i1:296-2899(-)